MNNEYKDNYNIFNYYDVNDIVNKINNITQKK